MVHYPVFLSDKVIRDEIDMVEHLTASGFDLLTAQEMAKSNDKDYDALKTRCDDVSYELRSYELSCDNYHSEVSSLVDEIYEACDRLESGKKGKGYTKSDIAIHLRKVARDTYENVC